MNGDTWQIVVDVFAVFGAAAVACSALILASCLMVGRQADARHIPRLTDAGIDDDLIERMRREPYDAPRVSIFDEPDARPYQYYRRNRRTPDTIAELQDRDRR